MGRSCATFDQSGNPEGLITSFRDNKPFSVWGLFIGFVLLAPGFLHSASANARDLVDRMVAEVNSRPILHSTVNEKLKQGLQIKISDYPAGEGASDYTRALEDAINFELILSHCEYLEIEISDEEVKTQVDRVLAQNSISLEQLKQFLAQQGKDYDEYERDMYEQILLMRFQGRVLLPQVKLTDKDVEAYYSKKHGSKNEALSLDIRKIFISLPSGSENTFLEEKKRLADEVMVKLADGLDFIEAEKIYSELSDARDEKPAMNVKLKDLDERIQVAIRPLNPGEHSKAVKVGQGIYIFYLQNKHLADNKEFLKNKEQLEFELRQNEVNAQMQRWLKEERQKSKIRLIGA